MSQAWVDGMPSTSRKTMTSRCAGGSASIASRMTLRVSPARSSSSGVRQAGGLEGPMVRPPGMSSRQKPGQIHRRHGFRREWDCAPLGAGPRTREVDDDAEHPSAERGATFVTHNGRSWTGREDSPCPPLAVAKY